MLLLKPLPKEIMNIFHVIMCLVYVYLLLCVCIVHVLPHAPGGQRAFLAAGFLVGHCVSQARRLMSWDSLVSVSPLKAGELE